MSAEMNKKLKDNNIIIARRELEMDEDRMSGGGGPRHTWRAPRRQSRKEDKAGRRYCDDA